MTQPIDKLNLRDLNFCPYKELELPVFTKDPNKIKSAFRMLALKWHPDRNKAPNAREKFEQIKLASEILLSESIRKIYDSYMKAKMEQQERMAKQNVDRQKVVDDLLRREKEYQDALRTKMNRTDDEEFKKAETELEKLIREVREIEKEENKQKIEKKKAHDHITSHFDLSTIKVKFDKRSDQFGDDQMMSETWLKNIFKPYGIIDKVTIDNKKGKKGYVMFRHRDSALKVISKRDEDNELSGLKLKIVSTSDVANKEERKEQKFVQTDIIEQLKSKYFLKENLLGKGTIKQQSLEDLEASLFQKIDNIKKMRLS